MDTLRHRGPDADGIWSSAVAPVTFGHKRLAVIDVSPLGHQPMLSRDGRYTITFNGEIYNFAEVRSELKSHGATFRSQSDTEVLLEGFACWGPAVLDRLVGQFAFAIWDDQERRLFLARDRFGEKPLYYAWTGSMFAFASEIGALKHLPGVNLSLDPAAVQLYLEHQHVPAPYSIYTGIRKLLPAHSMAVDDTGIRTHCYWDLVAAATRPTRPATEAEALEALDEELRRAVGQQLVADVPLGAFLSGGIDSTSVVALMAELGNGQVETFTIGFDVPGYDESAHAAAVAQHLGTKHTCEYLQMTEALDLIPRLPGVYGEPFGDYSALPTLLVSRVAREKVTVSLSGDGGDELFGGYQRYTQFALLDAGYRLLGPLPGLVAPALATASGRLGRLAGHVVGSRERDPYRPLVSIFNAAEASALTNRPIPVYETFDRAWAGSAGLPPRRRAMTTDLLTYLPEAMLVKVDRAAMAASLEVRAPFLDHRLAEWALTLPQEFVREKHLLKQYAFSKVPKALLDRPKQGFGVPVSDWFRAELRDLLRDSLTPVKLERLGIHDDAKAVERLMADHLSGRRSNTAKLWTLLMLSLWHDTK